MSGYRKGTRKPKEMSIKEFNVGGYKVPPALLILSLLAVLYTLFLFGSQLEKSQDAIILSAFSVISFAVFAYLSRPGSVAGLRPFKSLIDAYLALSLLTFIIDAASFFRVLPIVGGLMRPVMMSFIFAVLSVLLIWLLLYFEGGEPEDDFIRDSGRSGLLYGAVAFILCIVLGLAVLYFAFGGSSMRLSDLGYIAWMAVIFGLLSGVGEELWFRGLLLSRMVPLAGENRANIIQALAFGVFEAFVVYAVGQQLIYLPAVFVIGSILGYYWGRLTMTEKSIVPAALYHAGFYVLIIMPMFAGIL
ncbi:MAG TPA: CPBP family intramembrane glutamic endopeptidase [Methanocella sp.]|uniref:CPBP family intramembrane glutamic endopeptidase n=1 Tax=Methanocella sp. TaxID=2052833 RepID=UPI002BC32902|nr:CPBP family intramembrane glutamic endopeptidase [Methanocella sp.]HTY90601.1 CPBP family intramembrane glutamic endopeptidase [Methanocella sp.]